MICGDIITFVLYSRVVCQSYVSPFDKILLGLKVMVWRLGVFKIFLNAAL